MVTGGGTGLGRAIVEELASRGARVVLTYSQSHASAAAVVDAVGPDRAYAIHADVRRTDEVEPAVEEGVAWLGALDIVVNNAGTTRWAPPADLRAAGDDIWHELLDVNLTGAFRIVRAAAPHLRARGGSILNVASNSVFSGSGSSIPYVVSKAGVVSLTQILARVLAPGVRVNAIAPGWMETQWLDRHIPEDVRAQLREERPFVEVADVARFGVDLLANDAATGQTVVLDRGEAAGAPLRGNGEEHA